MILSKICWKFSENEMSDSCNHSDGDMPNPDLVIQNSLSFGTHSTGVLTVFRHLGSRSPFRLLFSFSGSNEVQTTIKS